MAEYGSPEAERSLQRPPINERVPYGVGTPSYMSVVLPVEVEWFQHDSLPGVGSLKEFMQVDIVGGRVTEKLHVVSPSIVGGEESGERPLTDDEYSEFIARAKENPDRDKIVTSALAYLLKA